MFLSHLWIGGDGSAVADPERGVAVVDVVALAVVERVPVVVRREPARQLALLAALVG